MEPIKTLKEFYDTVETNEKPLVIYFYTKWCPDCFAIKPHLPKLEAEFPQLDWFAMDRDIDLPLAKHLEIYGIPSFLVFHKNREIARYVDKYRKSYHEVKTFLDNIQYK